MADDRVAFLIAEFDQQYEQFRHQDGLRSTYLQIYFSLATVVLAGTGLALSTAFGDNLPLLSLVSLGYVFLFCVGQLSIRMLVALRCVQLDTAVMLDLIRSDLAERLDLRSVLPHAGRLADHPFYEPETSSTWVYRFIGFLNGVFLAVAVLIAVAAVLGGGQVELGDRAVIGLAILCVTALLIAPGVVMYRNQQRLRRELLELRERLDLPGRYGALHRREVGPATTAGTLLPDER